MGKTDAAFVFPGKLTRICENGKICMCTTFCLSLMCDR